MRDQGELQPVCGCMSAKTSGNLLHLHLRMWMSVIRWGEVRWSVEAVDIESEIEKTIFGGHGEVRN